MILLLLLFHNRTTKSCLWHTTKRDIARAMSLECVLMEAAIRQSGLLAAEHDLAEDEQGEHEDGEAEVLSRVGEVLADNGQRGLRAAVRDGSDDDTGEHDADDGLADDQAGGEQRAAAEASLGLFFTVLGLHVLAQEVTEHCADDERRLHGWRQVDAHADSEWRQAEVACIALEQLVDDDEDDAEAEADVDVVPGQRAREDALCNRRHQGCLRCGKRLRRIHVRTRQSAREAVRLIEQVQDRCDDERADDAAEQQGDLLAPRRSADEIARLEVLHVIVRDAGNRHDDGCREDGRSRRKLLTARHREDAEGRAERVHDERSHDDGEDADARDRARARADEAGHVGAGRGDEEAHEDSDADADKGERQVLRDRQALRADKGVEDAQEADDRQTEDHGNALDAHVDIHAMLALLRVRRVERS